MNSRCILLLVLAAPAGAQDSARSRPVLPPLRITATREGPRAPIELPYAISIVAPDSLAALRRQGVDELLFAVPGVALANRQNPAQDPRVSIRGFGARSAFGVRGVRVLQDGVPLTLPDGQTPVDALDLENASRVDVLRGSASSLYGNAAGGVIDLRSAAPSLAPVAPWARVVGGGGTPTIAATGASGTRGGAGYTASVTRIAGSGFRAHSDQRATRGALRLLFDPAIARGTALALAARVADVSLAESPGALTRAQFDADPTQADLPSVRRRAGKIVRQSDVSLTAARGAGGPRSLDATLFGSVRSLANPLTFATVDVERASGGASLRVAESRLLGTRALRLAAGADVQLQRDDRVERENCAEATSASALCPEPMSLRGAVRRDQREQVRSAGPYLRAELALTPTLLASAGVRGDVVRFAVRDRLVTATNGDDSGERSLRAVSPSAGITWRVAPLASLYASLSSSFETPTTTELANKPDGTTGLNPALEPQRTVTAEVGARGTLTDALRWDVALFQARARDELVPFDIPNGGGRRYFRNAGRTERRGAEVGAEGEAGPLRVRGSWTLSRFRYVEYAVGATSFAGNRIPGVPEQAFSLSTALPVGALLVSTTAELAGPVDVDDANSVQAPGRALLGIAVGGTARVGRVRLAPLVALQNLAGVRTVGSVSVNAAAGKFYEPAPGRTLLVRLAVLGDDGR